MNENVSVKFDGSFECRLVPGAILIEEKVVEKIPIQGVNFFRCSICPGLSDRNDVLCSKVTGRLCMTSRKGVVVIGGINS